MDAGEMIWAMYFAGVVSINDHPGAGTKDHVKPTLSECAQKADLMYQLHCLRWSEWRQQQEQ